jgi:hypothetical protein
VDPINLLQVELLRRLRERPDDRVRAALHVTINGIAAGLGSDSYRAGSTPALNAFRSKSFPCSFM